jgi:hypothetical protein
MDSLDLKNIFFEALNYPSYARPYFYLVKQKESGWSKGVYFTALNETYNNCKIGFNVFFLQNQIKIRSLHY